MKVKDIVELTDAHCTVAVIGPDGRFVAAIADKLLEASPQLADCNVCSLRSMSLPGNPFGRLEINVAENVR